jgi:hypothetical protein
VGIEACVAPSGITFASSTFRRFETCAENDEARSFTFVSSLEPGQLDVQDHIARCVIAKRDETGRAGLV